MKSIKTLFAAAIVLIFTMSFTYMADWYVFEAKEFTIEFPEKPTPATEQLELEIGNVPMDMLRYKASSDAEEWIEYNLTTIEYPDTIIHSDNMDIREDFFSSTIEGMVEGTAGKLLSEKEIAINDFPGREITLSLHDGLFIVRSRIYLVNNRMYSVQVVATAGSAANSDVTKFLSSFKLKK